MNLRKIQDIDLRGQKVLMRVGFNVPLENGKIKEAYKIESVKTTIDYILAQGGILTLVSHLGRPLEYHKNNPGSEWTDKFSLRQLLPELKKILNLKIKFVPSVNDNVIKKELGNLSSGKVLLLENVRFYEEEKNNDNIFAHRLAKNFDVFANDAFSVCHRQHASVVGVTEYLPSFAGLRMQEELANLDKVKNNPEHPAVAIIGGAKIKTKLPLIKALEQKYDFVLVGGKVAVEAIDDNLRFNSKIIIAEDFVDQNRLDIGPQTIKHFQNIIASSATIVWNGPLGLLEKKPFDIGTRKIIKAIVDSGAYSVVGGGESVQAVMASGLADRFSFISTGGGAMLKYLSNGKMPGLEVLRAERS